MHNHHIKFIILMIHACSTLNLLGLNSNWRGDSWYNRTGLGDNYSDGSSTGSYAHAVPVVIGRVTADNKSTTSTTVTGARYVDSREAVFERAVRPESFCRRLCACLCFRTNRDLQ